jgi:drug/metabolite transporter (DMT)-like permease
MTVNPSVVAALAAALLFGASTPFAKALLGALAPILLAGLLYLGSGLGLWIVRMVRDRGFKSVGLSSAEWLWLAGATAAGGVLGPMLLMYGLTRSTAADASLLLNLEAVLTALLAWTVFRENAGRRIVLGMALIVGAGVVLAWPRSGSGHSSLVGALAVAGACACWAVDNNLTRNVSAADPVFVAATKGLVAGLTNSVLAVTFGAQLPPARLIAAAMGVGFAGYGVSLVLFVLALRGLGSARTGAYFSTAPFVGAAIAIGAFHEPVSWPFWLAAAMMAAGVWLHLTEVHEHEHAHEPLCHTHAHRHDAHHQHQHAFAWDGREPHTHEHTHEPLRHSHPHYPDVHHRHEHGTPRTR